MAKPSSAAAGPRRVALATTAESQGGTWRHIEDLGTALQAAGIEVIVGLPPDAVAVQEAAISAGLEWKPLDQTMGREIDIWHIHLHDTYEVIALREILARRARGPVVLTEHLPRTHASDNRLGRQFPRHRGAAQAKTLFKRAQFALASEVISVSTSSRGFLERRYALGSDRVTVVHNGVSPPENEVSPNPPSGTMRVLALGNLSWQKGFDVLLEAARLARGDWKVTVIGSGPQLQRLVELAANLPAGRVEFAGWAEDPRPHMLAANVVCMPSRWESFPYTALEASQLCRPLVASKVDGLDEIVEDGVSGILVTPENPSELADALDHLSANDALVQSLALAARRRVGRYSISGMVRGTTDVYRSASRAARC